ncbi:spore-associated protein A [Nonomuraea spiralis]|uniref:Spore-associated protein A n=1 Tax=Nonomuraea spiralis TaxID=46182 RepID=A0ABV5IW60_9ACTN|nr:hypothetical protein [Nonomuraea spiralis]GGS85171.1 hypothetical protein GCM10010176_031120 [Nonomuraea spiralis]
MRKFRTKVALPLVTAAMLAGSVVVSSPANAASSPIAACGGGSYHVIDHHNITGGVIYLMYNGRTNCAVTWKTANLGKSTPMDVWIARKNDAKSVEDEGSYAYYAGPVKIDAPGQCINWGGRISSSSWYSGWSHCG